MPADSGIWSLPGRRIDAAERQDVTAAERQDVTAAERQDVTAAERQDVTAAERQDVTAAVAAPEESLVSGTARIRRAQDAPSGN